jgi:dephospho-CoA kinase
MTCILVITGCAGAGKTTLLGMFDRKGIPTLSADQVVHTLLTEDTAIIAAIGKRFPSVVVDNSLDRERYLDHVFDKPEHLAIVEEILHPRVYEQLESFVTTHKNAGSPLVVLEIPLYYETQPTNLPVDKVLVAWAPLPLRQERVLARKSMTLERFRRLRARQLPFQQKAQLADFIVDTRTPLEQLEVQVVDMIELLSTL